MTKSLLSDSESIQESEVFVVSSTRSVVVNTENGRKMYGNAKTSASVVFRTPGGNTK